MSTKSEYKKQWKHLNKDREKANNKKWNEQNKDKVRDRKQKYYQDNCELLKLKSRSWKKANRSKIQSKINSNPSERISASVRSKVSKILRGTIKTQSTEDIVGCSLEELKQYLISKFQPGMTLDNYGRTGWHIDHIRPLSTFDLTDKTQLQAAWHYSNLQPLWAKDNLIKGAKYEY